MVRKYRPKNKKKIFFRAAAFLTALVLIVSLVITSSDTGAVSVDVSGGNNTSSANGGGWGDASASVNNTTSTPHTRRANSLTLSQAKRIAYSVSEKKENLEEKIEKAQTAYANKVKAVDIKNRYISTFHWKFLFSVELPRDPDLTEIYEAAYDPAEKLEELREAQNDLKDYKISLYNDVTNYYIEIYKGRQRIDFDNERLLLAQDVQAKTEALVATGEKTEADLKAAEQAIKELTSSIASTQRAVNKNAKKLSKLLDMSTGSSSPDPTLETYEFYSPYQTDVIDALSRSDLDYLKSYTLEHDDAVFEARGAKSLAYVAIYTYWNAIKSQMSWSDMKIIEPYYNQIIAGQKVNKRDFKKAYKNFLSAIDRYWSGSFKIGFWPIRFSFSKTLFKGKRDGQWYLQDDPNCLLDASLEYMSAVKDLEETESDKQDEVEDSFETYITLKNDLLFVQDQLEEAKEEYEKAGVLYRIGELTADEYNVILDNYETLQTEEMDSLTSFSEQVSALNRLTCGALDELLGGDAVENENGTQLVVANTIEGASYYIIPEYEKLAFEIGIYIPDDFSVSITSFELWCDDVQIGERVDKDETIEHLMLATYDVDEVKIRLYNGDNFVSDCVIDAGILQGELKIVQYETKEEETPYIASYELTENTDTQTTTLKLIPNVSWEDNVAYFVLYDKDGTAIDSEELCEVDTGIRYLELLGNSLSEITVKLYDGDKNYLYDGTFDTDNMTIVKKQ